MTLSTCSRSFFTRNNIFIQEFALWLDTTVLNPFALTFSLCPCEAVPHIFLPFTSVQTNTNLIISQNGLLPLEGSKDMHTQRRNQLNLNPAILNPAQVGILTAMSVSPAICTVHTYSRRMYCMWASWIGTDGLCMCTYVPLLECASLNICAHSSSHLGEPGSSWKGRGILQLCTDSTGTQ